jgi:predicted nucleic acid-binding protein
VKALLDACVLYPTVTREMLVGVAGEGVFTPLWSGRILEEWARATHKLGAYEEAYARGEVAALRAAWPKAEVALNAGLMARLHLPDPDDIHVLAAAIAGCADIIVTFNASDFPRETLAAEGLQRMDPDQFLGTLFDAKPEAVRRVAERVLAEAQRLSGEPWEMRALLKKARLPKLGKLLG